MRRWIAVVLVVTFTLAFSVAASAQRPRPGGPPTASASVAPAPPPPPVASSAAPPAAPTPDDARKTEARSHFDLGLAHLDRGEWSAALAEFQRSRQIFPTRAATKNAAFCLRKEGRFDEALEMYETLIKEFPDLSPTDRAFVDKEVEELRASIGTFDVRGAETGATIIVDGRERGTFPLPVPLRIGAGTHNLRVYKEGFTPYEGRFDIAGKQAIVIEAKLGALTQGGRLRVTEQTGKILDVVVDNVVVGKTPWEGTLAVGDHTVILRGDGDLGTQPAAAPVKMNQLTPITLFAEELEASARIEPAPASAFVAVDGVSVGRGIWDGKLRVGGHKIEVASEGFLPFARDVSLEKGKRQVVVAQLERDPNSPLWAAQHPSRFVLELDVAGALAPVYGGDVLAACGGSCSSGLPLGGRGVFHGAYQLGSGLGFGLDVGYLLTSVKATGRDTKLSPQGLPVKDSGTVDDALRFSGLTLGGSASFHRGEEWPLTLRLGAGVFLGSANDARTGTFKNTKGATFGVNVTETPAAQYLYVAPEVRLGRRFGEHFELSVGVEVMVMTALKQPSWADKNQISTSPTPNTDSGDGIATFGAQALTGSFVIVAAPGVGARLEF